MYLHDYYGHVHDHALAPNAGFPSQTADPNKPCYDKVALLIGNRYYHHSRLQLNTPEMDTQDLAGILRSADFNVVSLVNLTKEEMDQVRSYSLHHTSHITHHSSHITHHSSHVTHHTSLITHHSSLITHHSSHITHQ